MWGNKGSNRLKPRHKVAKWHFGKWQKVVGILTELSAEIDCIKYVVVGIGINVNNSGFSEELKNKATSMYIEAGKSFIEKIL